MARNNDRDRGKKRTPVRDTNRRGKPKICVFCRDHVTWVDYKDVNVLRRFISDRAKIKARRTTGTCTQHQREVAVAIKTARELALIPYTQRTVSDKAGGREGRGGRGGPRGPRPAVEAVPAEAPVDTLDVDVDVDVEADGADGIDVEVPTAAAAFSE
jgi:small subunit ribosomal protein S18